VKAFLNHPILLFAFGEFEIESTDKHAPKGRLFKNPAARLRDLLGIEGKKDVRN